MKSVSILCAALIIIMTSVGALAWRDYNSLWKLEPETESVEDHGDRAYLCNKGKWIISLHGKVKDLSCLPKGNNIMEKMNEYESYGFGGGAWRPESGKLDKKEIKDTNTNSEYMGN